MDPASITIWYGPVSQALDTLGKMLAEIEQRAGETRSDELGMVATKMSRLSINIDAVEIKLKRLSTSIQKFRSAPFISTDGIQAMNECDAMVESIREAFVEARKLPGTFMKMKERLRKKADTPNPYLSHSRFLDIRKYRWWVEDQRQNLNNLIRSDLLDTSM
jgi:hypothetical protein